MLTARGLGAIGLASLCVLAAPTHATTITFDTLATGDVLTDQYAPQGVTFTHAYIAASGGGGKGAHSTNSAIPVLAVNFTQPVRQLFLAVYEFELVPGPPEPAPQPDDGPPPTDEAPPAEAPPADDAKPDASVFPTLYFTDGSSQALATVHALTHWQSIAYEGATGVTRLELVGDAGAFLVDNLSFSTHAVPAPGIAWLFPLGIAGAAALRRRVNG